MFMSAEIDYELISVLENKHSIQVLMEIYLHPYMSKTKLLHLNNKQGFKNKFNKIKKMEELGLVIYAEDSNTSMKGMIIIHKGKEVAKLLFKIQTVLKKSDGEIDL